MKTEHPITPPPELVLQWFLGAKAMPVDQWVTDVATQAARWGADMELEACCEFEATVYSTDCADRLRRHRRPKPPSLKEQALEALDRMDQLPTAEDQHIIRRALEALPDV